MKYVSDSEKNFFENRKRSTSTKPLNQQEAEFFAKRGDTRLYDANQERINSAIDVNNISDAMVGNIQSAIKNYKPDAPSSNVGVSTGFMGTSANDLSKSLEGTKERYQAIKREQQLNELRVIPEYNMNNQFDRIKAKYRLGQLTDTEGKEWTIAAENGDEEYARAISQTVTDMVIRYPELVEDLKTENPTMLGKIKDFVIGGVEGTAEMLPTMIGAQLRGAETGLPTAGGFAGMAAMLGQAGPQALAPEEILTVPGAFIGGYRTGSAVGTSSYMYEVEKGQSYKAMLDDGVDPQTANKWSTVVGLANAGIELAQVDTILKSFKGFDDVLTEAGQKSLSRYLKGKGVKQLASYAKGVGTETAQEVAQEGVSMIGEYAGKNEVGIETDLFSQENKQRLLDTAIQSAQTFAVMHGAGQTAGNLSRMLENRNVVDNAVSELEKSTTDLSDADQQKVQQLNSTLLEFYNSENINDEYRQWVVDTQNKLSQISMREQNSEGTSNVPDYLMKEKDHAVEESEVKVNEVIEEEKPVVNEKVDTSALETVHYNGKEHVVISNYKDQVSLVPKDTDVYVDASGIHRPSENEKHNTVGVWVPRSNTESSLSKGKVEINTTPKSWEEYKEVFQYHDANKESLNFDELQQIKLSYENFLKDGHPTRDLTTMEVNMHHRNMEKVVEDLIATGNDRNNMTFERSIGGISNAFTVTRGQEYDISINGTRKPAKIVGISQVNGKVKYQAEGMDKGKWIDKELVYPLTKKTETEKIGNKINISDEVTNISNVELKKYKPEVTQEYVPPSKGQGKRVKGMTMGGMGEGYGYATSIKYKDVLKKMNVPESDHSLILGNRSPFVNRTEEYLKAREYGLNHKDSLRYAVSKDMLGADKITNEQFENILREQTDHFSESKADDNVITEIEEVDNKPSEKPAVRRSVFSNTANKYKADSTDKIKPVHEIINDIKREFGLGYTTKRFRHRGAVAVYKIGPKVIESKIANSIGPTMHELGHHLDSKYGLSSDKGVVEMIDKLPENFKKHYKKSELPGEAIAEYVRMYLTTPMEASEFAGLFEDVFLKALKSDDGFEKIQAIQTDTMKWLGASIDEQINSTLVSHLDSKKFKDYKKDFSGQLKLLGKKQYMFWFNELQPLGDLVKFIEKSTGKKLPSDKNFELLADSSLRSPMIAKSITVDGMLNPKGEVVDVSFKEVMKDISEEEYQDFSNYLISKRALDYYKRGKRTFSDDIPIDYVKLMVDKYESEKPKFSKTAGQIYEWWTHFTEEWVVGTGLLEEGVYEKMKELEPHYVPFFRQRNESVLIGNAVKQIANRGYTDQRNPLKRSSQSGSADPIFYPIESMLMEIERYVTTVKKREVMLAIHDTYTELIGDNVDMKDGLGQIINKVNPSMKADKVDMTDKKMELTGTMYNAFVETLPKKEQLEFKSILNEASQPNGKNTYEDALKYIHDKGFNAMKIVDEIIYDTEVEFKPMDIDKEKNIVTIKDRENKTHHYEVYDPLLLQALLNIDTSQVDEITRNVIAMRRVMQSLITTFDPLFIVKNFSRDTSQGFTASAVSVKKYHKELIKAIVDEITSGEWSKAYRRAGGGYASPTGADRNALRESLAEVIPGWKKQHKAQTVMQTVEKVADAIEQAPRIVEYKGHIDKFGDTFENRLEALYRAQDVTTNFQRKGQVMRMWYGNLIPFFNAGLQGLDKFRRMHNKSNFRSTVPRALLGITMVTLSLYATNRRDPEYHRLNKYVRDNYYLIPTGENGKYIRIPKARELGMVYGATFERALESAIERDPDAWNDYLSNLASVMMPPHEMITKGFIDASNNKTWYGGEIVSYQYQQLQVDQQYRNTTSKISRELAKMIPDSWGNISSPMIMDYLMMQYTGSIGKFLIPMTDDVKGNGLDYIKRTFTTDVAYSNDVVRKFYDRYDSIKKIESTVKAGRRPKDPEVIVMRDIYKTAHDAIGELSSLYIAIDSMSDEEFKVMDSEFSKEMTKAETRRMIKLSIVEIADRVNQMYDESK